VGKRTSWGRKPLRRKGRADAEVCEGSKLRVAVLRGAVGNVDIRLYAAALPYALAGDAAAGCMLHRALAANVLAAGGLMLC
jgi:hypothetical protein